MKSYKLFINGRWVDSVSGKTFKSFDPSNGKPIAEFQEGNEKDIEIAVQAAEKAFPNWRDTPAPVRGDILFKVSTLLRQNKEALAKLVTQEMGKVLNEARGDVQEAIDIFEYIAGEGRRLFGNTVPSELKDKFCMTVRRPLGVVGLITPWNFPIAIPGWKLAPALLCGNTVVFKPSSDTPLCATRLVEILTEAGIPPRVVNLVTGPGDTAGTALIRHPRVRGISFTGSRDTGKFIVENAGLKKIGLELGGKNPIIIMDDADLDLALEGVLWGGFGTTGQRCTAASRVIIHKKVKDQFEKMLLQRVKKLKLGNGLKKETDVGPLVNKKALEKVHNYTEIGKKEGAKLLCGGKPVDMPGFFYEPTIFTDVKPSMRIAQEEIFGPTVSIIPVNDFEEAIQVANNVSYGLSSSIYTKDIRKAFIAMDKIDAGLTYINSSTIGSEAHLPFGGVKQSGNGVRESGIEGVHEFSETKTIYIDYSGRLQKSQGIE